MLNEGSTNPAPRVPLKLDVEFRRSYARQIDKGTLKNISMTGAFLELNSPLINPSDKIIVTFVVSGRKREISASVIWKNGRGCGIRFMPFNNRDVQIVDDLMYYVENTRESRRSVLESILKRVA